MGDLNLMSPEEIQDLFFEECEKQTPDINLIRVILDNGLVDVNAKDKYSRSPLYMAVGRNNIALAEYLISAGANVNAKTKSYATPLAWAVRKDNVEMQALLKKHGAL